MSKINTVLWKGSATQGNTITLSDTLDNWLLIGTLQGGSLSLPDGIMPIGVLAGKQYTTSGSQVHCMSMAGGSTVYYTQLSWDLNSKNAKVDNIKNGPLHYVIGLIPARWD